LHWGGLRARGLLSSALLFNERGDAFARNAARLEPVSHMGLRVAYSCADEIVRSHDPFAGTIAALAALLESPAMFNHPAGAHAIFVDAVVSEAGNTEHVYSHVHIITDNRSKV